MSLWKFRCIHCNQELLAFIHPVTKDLTIEAKGMGHLFGYHAKKMDWDEYQELLKNKEIWDLL